MALPLIVPVLAVLGIGYVALKALGKKGTSSTQPSAQTERKGTSVVRGAVRFDPAISGKILGSLTSYKTIALDHQPAPNTPNTAHMMKTDAVQEGNDRGFQFASLESANGNAILAPSDLAEKSAPPVTLVIRAVHPSKIAIEAAPGKGWAVLTDTPAIGGLSKASSAEVISSLGA